jgi:flagellin
MLAIKNNLMAENAARHLGRSYDALAKSVERLSSGLRINSAKDDAAGLAVRELIRADVAVLRQGSRNALDGISMLQAAEGAIAAIDEILIRMSELAEQSATGTYSTPQRSIMDSEFQELMAEITRIAKTTSFNGITLLDNSDSYDIHVGSNTYKIAVQGGDVTAEGLGLGALKSSGTIRTWVASDTATWITGDGGTLTFTFAAQDVITATLAAATDYTMNEARDLINSASRGTTEAYDAAAVVYDSQTGMYTLMVSAKAGGAGNDLTVGGTTAVAEVAAAEFSVVAGTGTGKSIDTVANAESALTALQSAINSKDTTRAGFGYQMNRMEAAVTVLDIQSENLLAAESRISDVDVATETAAFTRNQVLSQAAISMLAQANVMPQMALSLLQ